MSPELVVDDGQVAPESAPSTVEEPIQVGIESTVWRLASDGMLINSVVERHAAWLAENEKTAIYFYADLSDSELTKSDEETSQKVFRSLASVGLTEGQIINAVNRMQQDGILFREAAI